MTDWAKGIGAITMFVEDLGETSTFYREVFGLTSIHEDDSSTAFRFGGTILNLLAVEAAPELVEPAAPAAAGAGVRTVFSIEVEDVDATCRLLAERGVELHNGPMDRPWGIRTASFRDPAGHLWEIAQEG